MGYRLLGIFSNHDTALENIREALAIAPGWTPDRFLDARKAIAGAGMAIDAENFDLLQLHTFLFGKRDLLVGLMENPALIEHEGFSEALLSVFHLLDELSSRDDLNDLPPTDKKHLFGDMNRVYRYLAEQWLVYLDHLKRQYPYLFSLAVRKNPFNPKASPVVTE